MDISLLMDYYYVRHTSSFLKYMQHGGETQESRREEREREIYKDALVMERDIEVTQCQIK